MEQKKDLLEPNDIVFMLMETLKSNGTFDEFRRHCISHIDAKPTYQNWKQRIETNVLKFLSKVKYTPELNKNAVREQLRKHLLDGRETYDIEEGADRILTQVLAPRTISVFEPKIENAVNDYLGIKNVTPPVEYNGLKELKTGLENTSDVKMNMISNSKIVTMIKIDHTDSMENIEETSPEFEPLTSALDNDNSNDESISGMSDLISVGSPVQIISKENHDTNSNSFETENNFTEQLQKTSFSINGVINHKNGNTNIKSDDISKISNNTEKLKTNDSKSKCKNHSSNISSREKNSTHKSKDHNSNSREKNDIKKSNSSKDKQNSSSGNSQNKHYNDSKNKSKKYKHDKKSHYSDRDTTKRVRKNSRLDKKEKSSSLCKEPKALNDNRSDDESNAGGSSKQKNSINKNKSSSSDKSKSSSSNHKSNRRDNSSKEVVDKHKDKSSTTKDSNNSTNKNNQTDIKQQKCSTEEENKLFTNNSTIEEESKWNNFNSSITNDEQDAANVLLSMSKIPYTNSYNEIVTENIIYLDNSSIVETLNTSNNKSKENSIQTNIVESIDNDNGKENVHLKINNFENKLKVQENSNQTKIVNSNDNDNIEENVHLNIKNNVDNETKINHSFNKSSSIINDEIISMLNEQIQNEVTVTVDIPRLKLKLLPNKIQKGKRKKHHQINESKVKKIKLPKSFTLSSKVPVIDTISTKVSKPNNQKSNSNVVDVKINGITNISSDQLLHKKSDNKCTQPLNNDELQNSSNQSLTTNVQALNSDNSDFNFVGFSNENITTYELLYENSENKILHKLRCSKIPTFKGFSTVKDENKCEYLYLIKKLLNISKIKNNDNVNDDDENNYNLIDNVINNDKNLLDKVGFGEFKGFPNTELECNKVDLVSSHLGSTTVDETPIVCNENVDESTFKGFSNQQSLEYDGLKYVEQHLNLARAEQMSNIQHNSFTCDDNGKTINKVMAILYETNQNSDETQDEIYNQSNNDNINNCSTANNNNHNITTSGDWVVEQEMKYKLLPVKVKLERLLEYRCNN